MTEPTKQPVPQYVVEAIQVTEDRLRSAYNEHGMVHAGGYRAFVLASGVIAELKERIGIK